MIAIAYELSAEDLKEHEVVIKDANGNVLKDGDTVTVIKDLKIKGTSSAVKGHFYKHLLSNYKR
jgi:protein PhnA